MEEEQGKAWLWQVYQHSRGVSRDTLFAYFRGQSKKSDRTPEIINLVNTSVKTCFPEQTGPSSNSSSNSKSGSLQEWAVDKPACATYLYYMAAQHLLQELFPQHNPDLVADPVSQQQQQAGAGPAGQRFKGLLRQVTPSPACSELVASEEFHLPLVECAVQLVALIAGEEHQQQCHWATHELQRQGFAASLWQAARTFQECFSASSAFPLPPILQQYLGRLQELLLDGPALATGSQLYSIMERGGGCHFLEEDTGMVDNVLRAYAAQAVQRAQLVGWRILQQQQQRQLTALQQQQQQQVLPDSFPEQCAWLMDQVLLEHLDVCFGQAMSVVVACVVYVTAKLLQAKVTFKMVTEVIGACVENTPAGMFQRTELQPPQAGAAAEYGDVRMFYNARFLPAIECNVRQYLQDYQQHVPSIMHNPATADADAAAAAGVDTAVAQQMDTTEDAPAVQATPAATVAGVTPGRRPFGALHANTQAAGGTTLYAAKPAQGVSNGTLLDRLPGHHGCSSNFSNFENEPCTTAAAASAAPYDGRLLSSTQPEQPGLLAGRTSRRSTRSKAGASTGADVGAARAAAGFAAVPGYVWHLGLFDSAAAMSSPAPALAGRTPTRHMR